MTLPYDYARCSGTTHQTCQVCRRREPGREQWQSYIAAAIALDGTCSNFIEPQPIYVSNSTKPTQQQLDALQRLADNAQELGLGY